MDRYKPVSKNPKFSGSWKVVADKFRKLFRYIRVHSIMFGPRFLDSVNISTGTYNINYSTFSLFRYDGPTKLSLFLVGLPSPKSHASFSPGKLQPPIKYFKQT